MIVRQIYPFVADEAKIRLIYRNTIAYEGKAKDIPLHFLVDYISRIEPLDNVLLIHTY